MYRKAICFNFFQNISENDPKIGRRKDKKRLFSVKSSPRKNGPAKHWLKHWFVMLSARNVQNLWKPKVFLCRLKLVFVSDVFWETCIMLVFCSHWRWRYVRFVGCKHKKRRFVLVLKKHFLLKESPTFLFSKLRIFPLTSIFQNNRYQRRSDLTIATMFCLIAILLASICFKF